MTPTGIVVQLGLPEVLSGLTLEHRAVRAAGAITVLVLGYYLARLVGQFLGRPAAQRFKRPSVTRAVLRSARLAVGLVAVMTALWILGLRLGDIVLSVTVFSAVLGIVLAPIIGSIISGLFVLADQPYEIGDLVEIQNIERQGFIEDITLRYTKLFTLDNTFLIIPNSTIRERDVTNFSAEDERTRQSLSVTITYESDIDAARGVIEEAARDTPQVISGGPDIRIGSARYPAAPTCYIEEYADHGVLLTLRFWLKDPYNILRSRSAINERIWAELGDIDAEIAYPHRHHVFDETSGELPVELRDQRNP